MAALTFKIDPAFITAANKLAQSMDKFIELTKKCWQASKNLHLSSDQRLPIRAHPSPPHFRA